MGPRCDQALVLQAEYGINLGRAKTGCLKGNAIMRELNPIWIAVIYAMTSLVTLFVTVGTDAFFIFSDFYVWAAIFVPTLVIPVLIVYWRVRYNQWHWFNVGLGCLLVIGVSFGHLAFISIASATV